MIEVLVVLLVSMTFAMGVSAALILTLRVTPGPNEVVVLSGRAYQLPDGSKVGYRVVVGGTAFRVPLIETADRLPTGPWTCDGRVEGAYTDGGEPLNFQLVAEVGVDRDPAVLGNAVERFLGRGEEEMSRVATETVEGHTRGLAARTGTETILEDAEQFGLAVQEECLEDFGKLGLKLVSLVLIPARGA